MRGVANVEPITAAVAMRLGAATVRQFRSQGERPTVVIGKDTRLSGDMLEAALAAGACSMGADVCLVGVLPTPAIAWLTRSRSAAAGVVISASHNPYTDNGIKLFGGDGFKLPDPVEEAIEEQLTQPIDPRSLASGKEIGRIVRVDDAVESYADSLCRLLPAGRPLEGLSLVVDAANGAGSEVAPQVFRALGARVSTIGASPDGSNINDGCGAVHPAALQQAVQREGAQLGLALDGDGDRAILVDDQGEVVDGDEILAMIAVEMQRRGTLRGGGVVATVMSNLGFEIALRERGLQLLRTPVGDRYVVEEMRRGGFNLGGEQSGHLLFLDSSTTGDGIVAGLEVARLLVERQTSLGQLKRVMQRFPQVLRNVRVRERRDLQEIPAIQSALDRVNRALNERGRVLVRYSGTEPVLRVMVEGEDEARVREYADDIVAAISEVLGTR